MLTPNCLHYFHTEPSDDVMYVKGTDIPLTRKSIELSRVRNVEIVGKRTENKQKIKVTIDPVLVKGKLDPNALVEEYIFKADKQPSVIVMWRDNILKARDEYVQRMANKKSTSPAPAPQHFSPEKSVTKGVVDSTSSHYKQQEEQEDASPDLINLEGL
jgi:hypothetical protein